MTSVYYRRSTKIPWPETPYDVFDHLSLTQRFRAQFAIAWARVLGHWRKPIPAATSPDEMRRKDVYYWLYKARFPLTRIHNRLRTTLFGLSSDDIRLPPMFKQVSTATIGAAGDILRTKDIEQSEGFLFNGIADLLFEQDISFANLESPITQQPLVEEKLSWLGPPIECCSIAQFDILKGHNGRNFDILSVGNNHTLDMGIEGIETTQRILEQNGIVPLGTNRSPNEYGQARILMRNGIKFGFISDCFSLNGRKLSPDEEYRVHVSPLCSRHKSPQLSLLKRQVDYCKAQGCDFVIASIHWGYEFEFFPRESQVKIAHELIEYGVDTILGHHPHVVQPVEYYRTLRDPHRIAVIAYSLGSLLWGFSAPHLALSMMLNLKVSKGTLNGQNTSYLQAANPTFVYRTAQFSSEGKLQLCLRRALEALDNRDIITRRTAEKISGYIRLLLGEAKTGLLPGLLKKLQPCDANRQARRQDERIIFKSSRKRRRATQSA